MTAPVTRCKFRLAAVETTLGNAPDDKGVWRPAKLYNLKFYPVSSGSEENKRFWAATPGGEFHFNTINRAVAEAFEFGKEYFVDFTLAPSEPVTE